MLAYSIHLGNDKNKTRKANEKTDLVNTESKKVEKIITNLKPT